MRNFLLKRFVKHKKGLTGVILHLCNIFSGALDSPLALYYSQSKQNLNLEDLLYSESTLVDTVIGEKG